LAIVGRVVETHHGRVKIKSRPGEGTTIVVLLPIERPAEATTLRPQTSRG
jgi:signal transduction histidine kinase